MRLSFRQWVIVIFAPVVIVATVVMCYFEVIGPSAGAFSWARVGVIAASAFSVTGVALVRFKDLGGPSTRPMFVAIGAAFLIASFAAAAAAIFH